MALVKQDWTHLGSWRCDLWLEHSWLLKLHFVWVILWIPNPNPTPLSRGQTLSCPRLSLWVWGHLCFPLTTTKWTSTLSGPHQSHQYTSLLPSFHCQSRSQSNFYLSQLSDAAMKRTIYSSVGSLLFHQIFPSSINWLVRGFCSIII